MAGRDADGLVTALRERRVHTSASRRESGLLDLDAKGVAATLRVSPHYYNTRDEIDRLADVLTEVAPAS